jgi:hypothetical protein
MPGLISDQLLSQLRNVAYRQLVTPLEIKRPIRTETTNGTEEVLTTIVSTAGWLKDMNKASLSEESGSIIASTGIYELRLRQGIDIAVGDTVVIDEADFTVQDVNDRVTISLYLKAVLRRVQ